MGWEGKGEVVVVDERDGVMILFIAFFDLNDGVDSEHLVNARVIEASYSWPRPMSGADNSQRRKGAGRYVLQNYCNRSRKATRSYLPSTILPSTKQSV